MNKITVGIPAFNEEKNIAAIIIGLKKITDEIIVCNDGSTDSTYKIFLQLGYGQNVNVGKLMNELNEDTKFLYKDTPA